ncbi:MAG: glycosyl hydrolase family 18 protein [Candidatus Nanopelagicaceae bacterium]
MSSMRKVRKYLGALLTFNLFVLLTPIAIQAHAANPTPSVATPAASPVASPTDPTPAATNSVTATSSGNKPARKIYTGWIPYYSVRSGVARTIAYKEMIGEVSPFWYSLTSSKTIKNQFTSANPSLKMAEQVQLLRSQGIKILPAITDGTKKLVLYGYLSKESTRKEVVSTITKLVVTNNFDGIDLDLEGFAFVDGSSSWAKTKPVWTLFISELSASLRANDKLLSVTTPVLFDPKTGRKGSYFVYDWPGIAPYIDRLRIMSYDYSVGKPGPIGPLEWTEAALKYAISVIPASKVWVGIPGYGRDWVTKIEGTCPKNVASLIKPGAKAAVFDAAKGSDLALSYGTTPVYDATRGEASFKYQKTYNGVNGAGEPVSCTASRTAWYQDKRAYLARAEFVTKYRIGGLVQWTLSQASSDAVNGILEFARTIGPDVVVATLKESELATDYGATQRITAFFSLKDKSPIENLDVIFQFRRKNDETWKDLSSTKTEKDGSAEIDLIVGSALSFRAITIESWERMASESAIGTIKVTRSLAVQAPAYAKVGEPLEILAQLAPREGVVTLQVKGESGWRNLDSGSVSELNGGYLFIVYPKSRGFMNFRVTVAASEKYNGSQGEPFAVLIR